MSAPSPTTGLREAEKPVQLRPAHLFIVSPKRARKSSVEEGETNPVASTSTQLQHGLGIIVKEEIEKSEEESEEEIEESEVETEESEEKTEESEEEIEESEVETEESEVEHTELTEFPQQAMDHACSSSSAGQQLNPKVRRSKRLSSMVSKENEQYYEGCLVMGQIDEWMPGMIRKPNKGPTHRCIGSNNDKYLSEEEGTFYFYVQLFVEPTRCEWLTTRSLKLFNASVIEPGVLNFGQCKWDWWSYSNSFPRHAKGVKIAEAASKFSVEDRLRKFTLPEGASISNLLKDIDECIDQHATRHDSVLEANDQPVTPTQGNGRSCIDSVASMKKRMSDYQQTLREKFNREKEEAIKGLKTDKAKFADRSRKLNATVKKQAKEIVEFRGKLEKEKQEKFKYRKEAEKIKAAFDEMFGNGMTEGGTQA